MGGGSHHSRCFAPIDKEEHLYNSLQVKLLFYLLHICLFRFFLDQVSGLYNWTESLPILYGGQQNKLNPSTVLFISYHTLLFRTY